MKIGVMGAVTEEIGSIRSHMTDVTEHQHGSRIYHCGKINNHEIILVFSRWGKVAAAATATSLITEFDVDQIIFTGVAGAAAKNLNIGDIVIASELYQHDMDARPLFPQHQIPLTNLIYFKADDTLTKNAVTATQGLFDSLSQKIPQATLDRFNINNPQCRLGIIATGDQFIYDSKRTQEIINSVPDTAAVEMEGAAVAQVCHDYNIPFAVIRTISDKADHSSELDFPAFTNDIARHYSEHIVLGMLKSL